MSEHEAGPLAALRKPFPPEAIGKLPKGGTQLDYVGHAAVTDRLLSVDPNWTWEPVAFAEDGGPLIRTNGNMLELWGRLTVCGVTRTEVGTCGIKDFEPSKQLVSDFVCRAAMRFGVALDLWSKEQLQPPVSTAIRNGWATDEGWALSHAALLTRSRALPDEEQAVLRSWLQPRKINVNTLTPENAKQWQEQLNQLETKENTDG